MRAHFADPVPASPDSIDEIQAEPLQARIMEFKQNTKNMTELTEFIEDVLKKAEAEAQKKNNDLDAANKSQQVKDKSRQNFAIPDFKNGKVVNRARGFVVRIFDAICNCANNAAAAPTTRFKLRGKRQSTDANDTAVGTGAAAPGVVQAEETLALNKPLESKLKNGKDKKDGGGKSKAKGVTMFVEPEEAQMLKD